MTRRQLPGRQRPWPTRLVTRALLLQSWLLTTVNALLWQPTGTFSGPEGRWASAAASDPTSGSLFISGGFSHAYQQCMADVWTLDTRTGSWSAASTGPLPTGPLMGHTLTLFYGSPECSASGCLLLIGGTQLCSRLGLQPASSTPSPQDWNSDVWVTPLPSSQTVTSQTNDTAIQWRRVTSITLPYMAFHTATTNADGTEVYITGGIVPQTSGLQATRNVWRIRFDTVAGNLTATPVASLPQALFGHSAVRVQGQQLVVVGGLRNGWPANDTSLEAALNSAVSLLSDTVHTYSLSTDQWTTVGSRAPVSQASAFQAAWTDNTLLYTYGGIRYAASLRTSMSVYDLANARWWSAADAAAVFASGLGAPPRSSLSAPPMLVGAAVADTASAPAPAGADPTTANTTTTTATPLVYIFGGWQLPATVRGVRMDVWAAVDEEATWAWRAPGSGERGWGAWRLVAHGAPTARVEPSIAALLSPETAIRNVTRMLMCGGRVPGAIPDGRSAFTLSYPASLSANGGPWRVNLTDWATSYHLQDCWVLYSGGSSRSPAPPPQRVRVLGSVGSQRTDLFNTTPVQVLSEATDGGWGAGNDGRPAIVWEHRLDDYIPVYDLATRRRVIEDNGRLITRTGVVQVVSLNGSQVLALNTSDASNVTLSSPAARSCLLRLGATANWLAVPQLFKCSESQPLEQCVYDVLFGVLYVAVHGGLEISITGRTATLAISSSTCLYDVQLNMWFAPALQSNTAPRYAHSCAARPKTVGEANMVCYGGLDANNQPLSDTIYFSLPFTFFAIARFGPGPANLSHPGVWLPVLTGDNTPGPRFGMSSFDLMRWFDTPDPKSPARWWFNELAEAFIMTGGYTGSSADSVTARHNEVWMLNVGCRASDSASGSRVATWTQLFAVADSTSNVTFPTVGSFFASQNDTGVHQVVIAAPQPPRRNDGSIARATVSTRFVAVDSCIDSVAPICISVINTFRWVSKSGPGANPPCWQRALRSVPEVVVAGPSPVAGILNPDALQLLYTSTLKPEVTDRDGVSLQTEGIAMVWRVDRNTTQLRYTLPTVYLPAPDTRLGLTGSIAGQITLKSYGWIIATAPAEFNATTNATVVISLPPVIPITINASLPTAPTAPSNTRTPTPTPPQLTTRTTPTPANTNTAPPPAPPPSPRINANPTPRVAGGGNTGTDTGTDTGTGGDLTDAGQEIPGPTRRGMEISQNQITTTTASSNNHNDVFTTTQGLGRAGHTHVTLSTQHTQQREQQEQQQQQDRPLQQAMQKRFVIGVGQHEADLLSTQTGGSSSSRGVGGGLGKLHKEGAGVGYDAGYDTGRRLLQLSSQQPPVMSVTTPPPPLLLSGTYYMAAQVITPDQRTLPRTCIPGTDIFATNSPTACYQTVVTDGSGSGTLYFFAPQAALANTSQPVTGATPLYQVQATYQGAQNTITYTGTQRVPVSLIQDAVTRAPNPVNTTLTPPTTLSVSLSVPPPPPPPPLNPNSGVVITVTFRANVLPLAPPRSSSRTWTASLWQWNNVSTGPDLSQQALCTAQGPYNITSLDVPCLTPLGAQTITQGIYWALLQDTDDPNAVMQLSQVQYATGVRIPISITLTTITIRTYIRDMASLSGYNVSSSATGVPGAVVTLITRPSFTVWDTAVTDNKGNVAFSVIPSAAPTTNGFNYLATFSTPGLPADMVPSDNITITQSNLNGNGLILVELFSGFGPSPKAFLLCADGSSVIWPNLAGGLFPSQLPAQVVYAPGSQCAWMVQGLGGSLFASLNFSLLGQNDKLDVLATGNGGPRMESLTLTRIPNGFQMYKVDQGNLTILLRASTDTGRWGRAFNITWNNTLAPSTNIPTQLILLIVCTASVGGAMLAFLMLWHFCYRPMIRQRLAAQGLVDGLPGAPAAVAQTRHRRHVSKRLLKLLRVVEYAGPRGQALHSMTTDEGDVLPVAPAAPAAADTAAAVADSGDGDGGGNGTVAIDMTQLDTSAAAAAGAAATAAGVAASSAAGDGEGGSVTQDCCPICLADYAHGDKLRVLPCAHSFHVSCIDQWLGRDVCCPLCKRDVVEGAATSEDAAVAAVAHAILRKREARRQRHLERQAAAAGQAAPATAQPAAAPAAAADTADQGATHPPLQQASQASIELTTIQQGTVLATNHDDNSDSPRDHAQGGGVSMTDRQAPQQTQTQTQTEGLHTRSSQQGQGIENGGGTIDNGHSSDHAATGDTLSVGPTDTVQGVSGGASVGASGTAAQSPDRRQRAAAGSATAASVAASPVRGLRRPPGAVNMSSSSEESGIGAAGVRGGGGGGEGGLDALVVSASEEGLTGERQHGTSLSPARARR